MFLYTQVDNHTQRIRSYCCRRLHSHSQLTGTRQYLFRRKINLFKILNYYQQNNAICDLCWDSAQDLPSSQYWPVHPSIQSHRKLPFWFIQLLPSGQGESAHSSKSVLNQTNKYTFIWPYLTSRKRGTLILLSINYTLFARFPRPAIDAVASIRPLQVHARTSIVAQSLAIGTLIDICGQECIYKLNCTMLICFENSIITVFK